MKQLSSGFFHQVQKLSDEQKFDMYMKVPHEDLVRMHIALEKHIPQPHIEIQKKRNSQFANRGK